MTTFDILDRPIAFHRAFVTLTGSVTAALMLSQAIYWTRRTNDADGWFWKTQARWEEETGLTRREQETAREQLRALKFWQEQKKGMPSKLYFRVDENAMIDAFAVWRKAPIKYGGKRQSSMAESANQVWRKAPYNPYITESTSKTTPKTTNHHHHTSSSTIQNDDDDGINDLSALPHFLMAKEIATKMKEWTGAETFLLSLSETQLIAANSWLYLWFVGQYAEEVSKYKRWPFDGVKSIVGKIITQVRAGNIAPLCNDHKQALTEELKDFTTNQKENEP